MTPHPIIGTGHLDVAEPRVMRGTITLPGGDAEASLTITGKDRDQWAATLRIGGDQCLMLLFPPEIKGTFDGAEDLPERWHGYISVGGHLMRALVLTGGDVTLFDCTQPIRVAS